MKTLKRLEANLLFGAFTFLFGGMVVLLGASAWAIVFALIAGAEIIPPLKSIVVGVTIVGVGALLFCGWLLVSAHNVGIGPFRK